MSNYFFNVASSIVLGVLAGFITERVIEPRMWKQEVPTDEDLDPDEAAHRARLMTSSGRSDSGPHAGVFGGYGFRAAGVRPRVLPAWRQR